MSLSALFLFSGGFFMKKDAITTLIFFGVALVALIVLAIVK